MTSGTIEENIYKMQVFKGGLFKTATEHKEQTRYFSQKDIKELFSLPAQGFDVSLTQRQMHEEHDKQLIMDDSLIKHIEFLEKQGIAGVSHHSLLFSKTETVPKVVDNNEVQSKIRNRIVGNSSSRSVAERDTNGAEYAFKPKDGRISSRTDSSETSSKEPKNTPELIKDKIERLSQMLATEAMVSRLPDRGEKIQKRIHELNEELSEIKDSTLESPSQRKLHQVL